MTTEQKEFLKEAARIMGVKLSLDNKEDANLTVQVANADEAKPDVAPTPTPETDKPAEENKVDVEKQINDLNTRLTSLEDLIKQLTGEVAMSKKELESAKETNTKLSELVVKMAEMPNAEPIQRTVSMSASEAEKENDKYKMFVNKK